LWRREEKCERRWRKVIKPKLWKEWTTKEGQSSGLQPRLSCPLPYYISFWEGKMSEVKCEGDRPLARFPSELAGGLFLCQWRPLTWTSQISLLFMTNWRGGQSCARPGLNWLLSVFRSLRTCAEQFHLKFPDSRSLQDWWCRPSTAARGEIYTLRALTHTAYNRRKYIKGLKITVTNVHVRANPWRCYNGLTKILYSGGEDSRYGLCHRLPLHDFLGSLPRF